MTFYLKYRPQSLAELDQESVRVTLEKIVKSQSIPHAFLFSGPKGTGKTSAARILAKIINCEKGKEEPCNTCEQCVTISKGQNIDVIEIDAASHRGIEDIRMIRDAVKLSPAKAKKKVYIIDEAHMLTTEASNALLKTLEEPPDHVVFILATTNPEKLIETVRSRVTNVPFKKATSEEISTSLTKIADKEGIKIEKEFFEIIASKSDGSFRDASKILEQMILEGVDFEKGAKEFLKEDKFFDVNNFIKLLSQKDTKKALICIEDSINSGVSAKDVAKDLVGKLRLMLLSIYGLSEEKSSDLNKEELVYLIKLFSDATLKIQNALIEQAPLEIAVVEWCEKKELTGKDSSDKKLPEQAKVPEEKKEKESVAERLERMTSRKEVEKVAAKVDGQEINDKTWREILGKVKPGHTSTEALLRAAKPIEFKGDVLKIGVYYKFHKERLEEKQHRDILEEALEGYIGTPVKVVCTLTEPPAVSSSFKEESEVVLTEPNTEVAPQPVLTKSDLALTDNAGGDIIKLAEEIFSN